MHVTKNTIHLYDVAVLLNKYRFVKVAAPKWVKAPNAMPGSPR